MEDSNSDIIYYGNDNNEQCNLKRTSVQPLLEDDDVEDSESIPQPSVYLDYKP